MFVTVPSFEYMRKAVVTILYSLRTIYGVSPSLFALEHSLTIISSFFYLIYSRLEGNLIDSLVLVSRPDGMMVVLSAVVLLLGFTFIQQLVNYLNYSYLQEVTRGKHEQFLQKLFFDKYGSLDIGRIEQPDFQELKNKVSDRSLWRFQGAPREVFSFLASLLGFIVGAGILFAIHPVASVCVVLSAIPSFLVEIRYAKESRQLWESMTTERRKYHTAKSHVEGKRVMQELLLSAKVPRFLKILYAYFDLNYRKKLALEKKFLLINIISRLIETIGIGFALYFVILLTASGKLSVGDAVFSFGVLYSVNGSVSNLFYKLSGFKDLVPYLMDVEKFFTVTSFLVKSAHPVIIPVGEPIVIAFDRVSFRYPGNSVSVLQDVSFEIGQYQRVVLVGLNGSGKTTLIKLLLRMYDPTRGRILVNGIDLRSIDIASWYRRLGVLMQDYSNYEFLSIKESLQLFASKRMPVARLHQLLKSVDGEDVVRGDERGVNLVQSVEYGGKELSGGQFQKVALARTLAMGGDFLVLDEPTSAIDALSEEKIFKMLNAHSKNASVLYISHRFTTIRNAERILVLKKGRLVEHGSHAELMKHRGLYSEMYTTQVIGK